MAETRLQQSDDITFAVFTNFEEPCLDSTTHEMRVELAEILAPLDLRLEWRSAKEYLTGETFNHIVTVRFRGHCLAGERWSVRVTPDELGLTHITDGEVLPFCEVRCDAVRQAAQPYLLREGTRRMPVLLGRALARVLAHEIYHMVARTRVHGKRGIARPSLTPEELVMGTLHFDAAEIVTLRNRTAVSVPADRGRVLTVTSYANKE